MLKLVFLLCPVLGGDCDEHAMPVYDVSPIACFMGAPAELARMTPPGWRVARWSCRTQVVRQAKVERD